MIFGLLYGKWKNLDGVTVVYQLILPKAHMASVLEHLHISREGEHFGIK